MNSYHYLFQLLTLTQAYLITYVPWVTYSEFFYKCFALYAIGSAMNSSIQSNVCVPAKNGKSHTGRLYRMEVPKCVYSKPYT